MNPLVVIPARRAARRLPDKPLADLAGEPMIVQVWRRAVAAGIGPVAVACDDPAIAGPVRRAGGHAIEVTTPCPSGSDRVHAALAELDPGGAHDVVVNLQGDMPTIDPAAVRTALAPLTEPAVDIATLGAPVDDRDVHADPAAIKIAAPIPEPGGTARALYFSRAPVPAGDGPVLHHLGIYAYRRRALERFVRLPPAPLEQREKLEQLRALADGMRIDVARVETLPPGVDTAADLDHARALLGARPQRSQP